MANTIPRWQAHLWIFVFFALGLMGGFFVGGNFVARSENSQTVDTYLTQLRSSLEQCRANFNTYTVLYEPGEVSAPLLNGALSLGLRENIAGQPRWIIPARVEPRVTGGSLSGLSYVYVNGMTQEKSGPFEVQPYVAGAHFKMGEWQP